MFGEANKLFRSIAREFPLRSHRIASEVEGAIHYAIEANLHANDGEEDLPFHRVRAKANTNAISLNVKLSEPVLCIGINTSAEKRGYGCKQHLCSLVCGIFTPVFVTKPFVWLFIECLLVKAEFLCGGEIFKEESEIHDQMAALLTDILFGIEQSGLAHTVMANVS